MTTPIAGIQPLWEGSLFGEVQEAQAPEGAPFFGIFQGAIESVRQADDEKSKAQYLLATGQLEDPVAVNIAMSQYQMSAELLIQLRNKALEAYSELTRINM